MRIAFIGGRDIHILGGIENYMLNLATQLVSLGHEPIVFCESDHYEETWINGFKVIYMSGPKSNLLCKPWVGLKATLKCIFKIKGIDFIHYNAWPPSLWSPLARIFGIKSLMQGHGLEWKNTKYSFYSKQILKFMEMVTAYLNKNLIMCSEYQASYFKKKYHRNAITIPTAVNIPNDFSTSSSTILSTYNIKPQKYFLFLGRLTHIKNPNCLITAFQNAKLKDYQLVIAGSNNRNLEYVKHLYSLAQNNSDIIFTGNVYGEDKDVLFRNAYAFCIVSTFEGLSISLLEAMSYKIPVIASTIPANKEVLDEDKALWVRPQNVDDLVQAFHVAINSPELLQGFKDCNYEKVATHYTWEKVAQKYVATVNSFL